MSNSSETEAIKKNKKPLSMVTDKFIYNPKKNKNFILSLVS